MPTRGLKKTAAKKGTDDERKTARDGVREDGEHLVACFEADYESLLQEKLDKILYTHVRNDRI